MTSNLQDYVLKWYLEDHDMNLHHMNMHFDNLKQAFHKLISLNFNEISLSLNPYGNPMAENPVISTGDRNLLEVKWSTELPDKKHNSSPGLFFCFPETIGNFEKMAKIDLSPLKASKLEKSIFRISRLLEMKGADVIVPTKSYIECQEIFSSRRHSSGRYSTMLTSKYFEQPNNKTRTLKAVDLVEIFNFKSQGQALLKMLEIDLNKTDKYVAWVNQLDSFYSDIRLSDHDIAMAKVFSTILPKEKYLNRTIAEKGIYLLSPDDTLNNELEKIIRQLPKANNHADVFILADINKQLTTISKRPETDKLVMALQQLISPSIKNKIVKKAAKTSGDVKPAKPDQLKKRHP